MIYVRVRDLSTGHHYDIPLSHLAGHLAAGAVEELPGRRHEADAPRRPKHHVRLDGRPATPIRRRPADTEE